MGYLAIYRSLSLNPLEFIVDLENYFKLTERNNAISVIVGDLNIDLILEYIVRDDYLNVMSEFGY